MFANLRLRAAARAFTIHLGLSILVAALAGALVLGLWFPYPYRVLAGGQQLFWVMVGVDVVCGPLLTAILFNPQKSHRALRFDLTLIATIQLAALLYGLHSISGARPVVLAFEMDRFVAVAARQVNPQPLATARRRLSWNGPELVGTRWPKDGAETLASIDLSLQGIEPSARPDWWQPYELSRPAVQQRMRPLRVLHSKLPFDAQVIVNAAAKKTRLELENINYLPLVSYKSLDGWIVLLDKDAHIIGYAPVGGFN